MTWTFFEDSILQASLYFWFDYFLLIRVRANIFIFLEFFFFSTKALLSTPFCTLLSLPNNGSLRVLCQFIESFLIPLYSCIIFQGTEFM